MCVEGKLCFFCNILHVVASHLATGPNMTDSDSCTVAFHHRGGKKRSKHLSEILSEQLWPLITSVKNRVHCSQQAPANSVKDKTNRNCFSHICELHLWINYYLDNSDAVSFCFIWGIIHYKKNPDLLRLISPLDDSTR